MKNQNIYQLMNKKLSIQIMQKRLTGFRKILKSELITQFTISSSISIVLALILPLIAPMLSGSLNHDEVATYTQISRSTGLSVFYAFSTRAVTIFREKTTLERNRAIYLRYGKNGVLVGKLLIETGIFIASTLLTSIIGILMTVYKNDGKLATGFAENILTYIIATIVLYLMMIISVKWALTSIYNKKLRAIAVTAVLLLVIGTFVIGGLTQPLVKSADGKLTMVETIVENKYIFATIPFLNITIIPMAMTNRLEAWIVVPFIAEALLAMIVLWRPLAKNLKLYLTI